MSTRALLLTAILLAAAAAPAVAKGGVPRCGWKPVKNVSDPHIQELGSWAVAEHVRRANDGLRFGKVVSAQAQIVDGTKYKLFLDAADASGRAAAYWAVVYEQDRTSTRNLESFFAPASEQAVMGWTGPCLE